MDQQEKTDYKIKCNECGFDISVPQDVEKGEILSCGCCGEKYEVKSINLDKTLNVDYLTIEKEDWGE